MANHTEYRSHFVVRNNWKTIIGVMILFGGAIGAIIAFSLRPHSKEYDSGMSNPVVSDTQKGLADVSLSPVEKQAMPNQSGESPSDRKRYNYQNLFTLIVSSDLPIIEEQFGRVLLGNYISIRQLNSALATCRGDCPIIEFQEDRILSGVKMSYLRGYW